MLTDHLYLFGRGLLVGGSLGFPQEWRRLKTKVSKRTVPLWPQLREIPYEYFTEREQAGGIGSLGTTFGTTLCHGSNC